MAKTSTWVLSRKGITRGARARIEFTFQVARRIFEGYWKLKLEALPQTEHLPQVDFSQKYP
jgi:hypothetical protein